jgi:hypothetical protein
MLLQVLLPDDVSASIDMLNKDCSACSRHVSHATRSASVGMLSVTHIAKSVNVLLQSGSLEIGGVDTVPQSNWQFPLDLSKTSQV